MSSTYEGKTHEQLKRSRSAILGVTTKLELKLRPLFDKEKENVTADDLSYLRAVEKQLKRLENAVSLNAAALQITPDTDNEMEKEIEDADDFENKIGTQLERISSFLEQFEVQDPVLTAAFTAPTSTSTSSPTTGHLKMPKFDLPKFNGQYKGWTPFYEQFLASVDSNTVIPDIQKFNYLKASLTGEALQLVSHLPLSNSNYKIALKSLTDRYNNERLIVNSHLDAILQLKPLRSESASELRQVFVSFEENLMAIEALNVNTEASSFIWVRIVSEKLDHESRRQWELDYPGKKLQTLDQLRDFVNKRVQALEASNSAKKEQPVSQNTKFVRNREQRQVPQNYQTSAETCPCCSENHKIYACKKFSKLDMKEKKALVYSSKLCFNCLNSGHVTKDCKSKHTCKTCHGKHNTLLHADLTRKGEVTGSLIAHQSFNFSASGVIPTALVPVADDTSTITVCRAMIDSGSQLSLITESAVQKMQLKRRRQSLTVNGIGNVAKTYNSGSVLLRLKPKSGSKVIEVRAFILPSLTQLLPSRSFHKSAQSHIRTVNLADPEFNVSSAIDLILGADIAEEIALEGKFSENNGLHFRNTVLDWIVSGKQPNHAGTIANTSLCINDTFDLKQFWELEEVPKANKYTSEEIACEKHFQETTTFENNRFTVQMPFKSDAPALGDTYVQAKRRFLSLEKRLEAHPTLRKGYSDFIHEFINLEHLELVPEDEILKPDSQINFLPHHCVHKEDNYNKAESSFRWISQIKQWNLTQWITHGGTNCTRGSIFNSHQISNS